MAKLLLKHEGVILNTFPLNKAAVSIGRKMDNDIQLNDSAVSSKHAQVVTKPSEYLEDHSEVFIEDLGSTNGTQVNGQPINSVMMLRHGDNIQIGNHQFVFDSEQTDSMESTAIYLPDHD